MNSTSLSTGRAASIVIFGASGDLTRRKLVPALHSLACGELLHPSTQVLGVARSDLSDVAFRERLFDGVTNYARLDPDVCELWPNFAGRHSYMVGSYDDPETYRRLAERLAQLDAQAGNVLFYLATPPVLYPVIVEQLGQARLNQGDQGWRRIIIEKPFGHDLESARQLNEQVHAVFDERQAIPVCCRGE